MRKILLILALGAAFSGASYAAPTLHGAHAKMNMPCETCHGDVKPREVPEESQCLKCHASRDAIQARTAGVKPVNPHYGHDASIECIECHKQHETPVLTCDQCHKFGLKTP